MTQKITLSFKLILLGDSNTGKTAILNQYIYHTFTNTKATTGIDFFTKIFEIQDFIVKLSIFDTAGQERYLAMTKSYFRGTNAAIFTYSLTEKQSFLNVASWVKKFQEEAGSDALKIVVGTKRDLKGSIQGNIQSNLKEPHNQKGKAQQNEQNSNSRRQQITPEEIQLLLQHYNITFSFQTSALLNQNIDEVFEQICKYLILKQMNKTNRQDSQLNRSRVETQFSSSRRRYDEQPQKKMYLQQEMDSNGRQRKGCC